jgi:hypothetical protein
MVRELDTFEIVVRASEREDFHYRRRREWTFGPEAISIDYGDLPFVMRYLDDMPDKCREFLVDFCRTVCAAGKKKEMTGSNLLYDLWQQGKLSTRVRNVVLRGLGRSNLSLLDEPASHLIKYCQGPLCVIRQLGEIGRNELLTAFQFIHELKGENNENSTMPQV